MSLFENKKTYTIRQVAITLGVSFGTAKTSIKETPFIQLTKTTKLYRGEDLNERFKLQNTKAKL